MYIEGLLASIKLSDRFTKVKAIIIILAILDALLEATVHNNPKAARYIAPIVKLQIMAVSWENVNIVRVNQ